MGSEGTAHRTPVDGKVPVLCPTCGASGSLFAGRIPADGATVTCPKCKSRFPVQRPHERAASPASADDHPTDPVPYRCPQCGREGMVSAGQVPEGGTGMNCPGCNTRFFVRLPGEVKPEVPEPRITSGGAGPVISASPGLVGLSAAEPATPRSRPAYPMRPNTGPARIAGTGSGGGLALDEMWGPSIGRAALAGTAAAFIGSVIWALITVITSYQIGWMAIGVGALVGFAVNVFGRGTDQTYGFIGAGLALLGCAIGNLMAACAFISSDPRNPGFFSVFFDALGNTATAASIMGAAFHPMDILFYILAISTGYKVALSDFKGT